MSVTSPLEVEAFLDQLKTKLTIWSIVFENRDKNIQTLLDLGITEAQRLKHIKNLTVEDFVSGPTNDSFGSTPLWVFGIDIYGSEIYIKLQLNQMNKPVICISFHIAEFPLSYPYK
jgi:hypothetical protein